MTFKLETPRLIIRSFIPEDEAPYIGTHLDPVVNVYLPVRSAEQYHELFHQAMAQADAPLNRWTIADRDNNAFIGSCLLREFDPGTTHTIELGYSLAADAWGRGYATEMIARMIEYAFSLPQTHKLVAVTDPDNKGSQAVLLKNGFVYQGEVQRYEDLRLSYFEYIPGSDK
ncbi:GNAT family N-acetyltransferase [Taibaiella koreensis]|uniref:GNAT family N-acetyltransferase n=1 Tax=Taibaiella koreensis TaxID=1268548 RepID=UPI000E5A02EF|nr:GNAT family N-acetyltransferase [Taibaiella koreensis]